MIQAPQIQYVPPQTAAQVYQQQGAQNGVLPQNNQAAPGGIYNYPVASSYAPVQHQSRAQYNGVNIEILNPQGQGGYGVPQQGSVVTPQNNGQFNGVNLEILNPQGQGGYGAAPSQNVMPAQYYPAQYPQVALPPTAPYPAQYYPAAPQAPVLPNLPPPPVPEQQITTPTGNQGQNINTPIIDQPAAPISDVTPESFAGRLKTDNLDDQKNTIEEIAQKVRNSGKDGIVLLDTQVFDALVDVINKDTSSLEGPTPDIIESRQNSNTELNYEEMTPLEKAETNKQFALYTISFMQELLNQEIEKRNGSVLELKDLPCIDTIVSTVKSNENPILRYSAIAALSHIARPDYNNDLNTIFTLAQADEDENVKTAAAKAIENLRNSQTI